MSLIPATGMKLSMALRACGKAAPGSAVTLTAAGARSVDPGQGLHLDTSLTAFRIAVEGGGIALGRSSLAVDDLATGRLIAPFALKVRIDEAFYLFEPQTRPAHPSRDVFANWIKAQAAAQLPGIS